MLINSINQGRRNQRHLKMYKHSENSQIKNNQSTLKNVKQRVLKGSSSVNKMELMYSMEYFYFLPFFLSSFLAVLGLHCCMGFLLLQRAGATLRCSARASHCGGFSFCRARALGTRASVVVARGLSSCGARAQLLHGMWDLPGPGLEPLSPALAGRFFTTAPPGKSLFGIFEHLKISIIDI